MLAPIAIWLQNTEFFTYLRYASYAYLIILPIHVICMTLFGGMILATDLRLLGWGFRNHSPSEIVDQLRVPKRIGFCLVATCGFLLYGSKAEEYYYNPFFRVKISLLILAAVHAAVFRGSVYNNAAELDRALSLPRAAKLAAALSLAIWVGIACAGRAIGYINPGKSPHHYTSSVWSPTDVVRVYLESKAANSKAVWSRNPKHPG